MHFTTNLVSYLLPINLICAKTEPPPPEGTDFVVTNNTDFVVTNTGAKVIAKAYV